MKKVIIYIDGFNLYFGLKSKKWSKYYWLDVEKLSLSLTNNTEELVAVKYFTSRISKPPNKQKRQSTYLDALETLKKVKIYYGKYQNNPFECYNCGNITLIPNEKKTDVNIAVEMMADAFTGYFDKAIIISADSDLVPPVQKIIELFPNKSVIVAFPPDRSSKELKSLTQTFIIGEQKFKQSQLPDIVISSSGFSLQRPKEWT